MNDMTHTLATIALTPKGKLSRRGRHGAGGNEVSGRHVKNPSDGHRQGSLAGRERHRPCDGQNRRRPAGDGETPYRGSMQQPTADYLSLRYAAAKILAGAFAVDFVTGDSGVSRAGHD